MAKENLGDLISDPQEVAQLCRTAQAKGEKVVTQLEIADFPVAKSFPELNTHPLFFIHIPKTAGASVNQFLESQFDDADICPGWNPPDLAMIGEKAKAFRLFRGHFTAGQLRLAPHKTELFTILRDPAAQTYSLYTWLRRLDQNYWKKAEAAAKQRNFKLAMIPGKADRRHSESGMRLARTSHFPGFLQKSEKFMRLFSGNLTAFYLGDTGTVNFKTLSRQRHAYAKIIATSQRYLNHSIATGIYERLEQSLQILCWRRGWAAPSDLPRIHSFKDNQVFRAIDGRSQALIARRSKIDFRLYSKANAKLKIAWSQLEAAAGKATTISSYLDIQHRTIFFKAARTIVGLDVTADNAWPGTGWGLRERNEHGQVWRWIGGSGQSSMLAKLDTSFDYLVSMTVHTATDGATLDSLCAFVGNTNLVKAGRGQQINSAVCHWLMARDIVARCSGSVEIEFAVNAPPRAKAIAVARITIHPW